MLADSKKSRTFASLLKRSTSERKSWRDGRVVDRGGLENRCTERYRGFESLSLRQVEVVNHKICNLFLYELFFHSFVSFIKQGQMNDYERIVKWKWISIILIIILVMALCMHA